MTDYDTAKQRIHETTSILGWQLMSLKTETGVSSDKWQIHATAITEDNEYIKLIIGCDSDHLRCESIMFGSDTGFTIPLDG